MEMKICIFLLFLWLLSYLFLRWVLKRKSTAGCRKLPPSPMALPLLGHLYLVGPLLHQSFDALAERYGPLMNLRLGALGNTVIVSSPALAKEFLKTHDLTFASRPSIVAEDYLGEDSVSFTFLPYGTKWKFLKKLLMTEIFSPRKIEKMASIRREEIKRFLRCLHEKSRAGVRADLEDMLPVLTNNIICRMTMSLKCFGGMSEANDYRKLVQEHIEFASKLNTVQLLMGSIGKLDLFGYGKKLKKANERFQAMMDKIIDEHERKKREYKRKEVKEGGEDGEEEGQDLVDILLNISEDEEAECKITRRDIRTCLLDISAAGIDTSAITIQWALAEILKNPKIFSKVRQEIESVVGTKRLVNESDIPNLPYIQSVVKETLRMHPPAPINLRLCREDCTVAGFYIPKNTNVVVNAWSVSRDPKYWENPHEFQPERFLNSDGTCHKAVDFKGQHFQYLPFGSGRRMCPGMTLSLNVILVTVASMVQCFDWIHPNGDMNYSTKMNLKEKAGLTSHMEQPLCCIPVARCVPFANPP